MRHLSSSREARHCRVAACSLILVVSITVVVFILTAFLPVMVLSEAVEWWMILGIYLLVGLTAAASVSLANRFRCPVCRVRPLAFHLADYRNPHGFLIQGKLATSWQILSESCFHCPSCGQWVAVRHFS